MQAPRTDIMAPDNEPTDEELALVMREARDEAVRRRDLAAVALKNQIRAAVNERLAARRARSTRRSGASNAGS
ncbi:MAG: hypothetical protein A2138_05645 [Deltaproteobacteria bacterium RBG_16_71_12]|nr:MAG: hypothetical protein A2138_05645 [Deltaproteobacteria bacterium RBG_16_71_12]